MKNVSFAAPNERAGNAVPAVGRVVRVLDEVAHASGPLGISEIARRTGLNKSSVHDLIASLVDEGLLAAETGGGGYVLGPRLISLGARARDQHLLETADLVLQNLPLDAGLSGFFGRLEGQRVTILASNRADGTLSLSAPVGSWIPADAGALGTAYLAVLGEEGAVRQLLLHPPRRFTEQSIVDRSKLLDAARATRELGFALERGEYLPGIAAVAAGLERSGGVYFIWVVGIEANCDDSRLAALGGAIRDAVREMHAGIDSSSQMTTAGRSR